MKYAVIFAVYITLICDAAGEKSKLHNVYGS